MKKKAVIIFSGGVDSVCTSAYLKSKFDLYGISFSYGQRANNEIKKAKKFAKILKFKEHKVVDISFMKDLYGKTNVLTDSSQNIPKNFEYSIVVPIRNAVFLAIASAWAYTINASIVAYGAHTGDRNYPDCRPLFSNKIESAFNQGEIDGIKKKIRKKIKIWTPYKEGLSKGDLIKVGHKILNNLIFETWSCYANKKHHCGRCESCNNRMLAFRKVGLKDKTRYMN